MKITTFSGASVAISPATCRGIDWDRALAQLTQHCLVPRMKGRDQTYRPCARDALNAEAATIIPVHDLVDIKEIYHASCTRFGRGSQTFSA